MQEMDVKGHSMSVSDIDCKALNENGKVTSDDIHNMSEEMRLKYFGASSEEMKKWSALQRLGITYDDLEHGDYISNSLPMVHEDDGKLEQVTGFSKAQVKRSKALAIMGSNEEDLQERKARELGSLGHK